MQEFLNPKSMLTPGVAGAFIMFLVNGLAYQFPEMSPRYAALGLSFLVGAAVLSSQDLKGSATIMKGVYWLLNSLVIFTVGFGSTHLAADAVGPQGPGPGASLFSFAYAQTPAATNTAKADVHVQKEANAGDATAPAQQDVAALAKRLDDALRANEKLTSEVQALKKDTAPVRPAPKKEGFFRRW